MAVNFSKGKVDLNKNSSQDGAGVALDNKGTGLITATLKWRSGVAGGADLDLFGWVVGDETKGRKGGLAGRFSKKDPGLAEVVYHKNLGSLSKPPYVEHGDSKVPGQETMRIGELALVDYVMFGVYQAYGNGVGSLKSFGATVTITDTEGNQTTVNLVENHPNRYWAAVALVDLTPSQGYVVKAIETYSKPGTEKSPVLKADGSFTMNEGPTYLFK